MPTVSDLEKEVSELSERLRVTQALLEAMRAYEQKVGRASKTGSVTIRQRSSRAAPVMNETERVAADLMERTNGPVATIDVVNEMFNRGLAVPPQNAVNVISARLSNNPRFKGKRGVGYWFADRPWPGELGEPPEHIREFFEQVGPQDPPEQG